MKKTQGAKRAETFADRQRAMGRKGRKKWFTPEEHDIADEAVEKFRRKQAKEQQR